MPELMGREPTAHPSGLGRAAQLRAHAGGCALSSAGRSAQDAEHRADRQRLVECEPRVQLRPAPAVHADLAAFAAFPAADEDRTARLIEVVSTSASASLTRRPARHSTTISA